MKVISLLLVCVFSLTVSAQDSDPAVVKPKVSDLAWMAGCWVQEGKNKNSFLSEQWTKPLGLMLGTNRTVRDGKVKTYEFMRIEPRDGDIYYVAKPASAAAETGFKLISVDSGKFVFENKEHDFPKRLIYSSGDGGELKARVEDDSKGIDFVFKKVDCEE